MKRTHTTELEVYFPLETITEVFAHVYDVSTLIAISRVSRYWERVLRLKFTSSHINKEINNVILSFTEFFGHEVSSRPMFDGTDEIYIEDIMPECELNLNDLQSFFKVLSFLFKEGFKNIFPHYGNKQRVCEVKVLRMTEKEIRDSLPVFFKICYCKQIDPDFFYRRLDSGSVVSHIIYEPTERRIGRLISVKEASMVWSAGHHAFNYFTPNNSLNTNILEGELEINPKPLNEKVKILMNKFKLLESLRINNGSNLMIATNAIVFTINEDNLLMLNKVLE